MTVCQSGKDMRSSPDFFLRKDDAVYPILVRSVKRKRRSAVYSICNQTVSSNKQTTTSNPILQSPDRALFPSSALPLGYRAIDTPNHLIRSQLIPTRSEHFLVSRYKHTFPRTPSCRSMPTPPNPVYSSRPLNHYCGPLQYIFSERSAGFPLPAL